MGEQAPEREICEYSEHYPNAKTFRCVLSRGHQGYHRESLEQAEPRVHTSVKEADGCEGLREALEQCAQLSWEGCDIDGGDFHDLMVRLGLFVEVPADEEYKEEWDTDTMFVLAWSDEARAALALPNQERGKESATAAQEQNQTTNPGGRLR
ncbi:MAG: hypothetical protein V3T08_09370 [Gemmatimonadota bacterium]